MTRSKLFHLFKEFGAIRKIDIILQPKVSVALIIYDDLVFPNVEKLKGIFVVRQSCMRYSRLSMPTEISFKPEKMATLEKATSSFRREVPHINETLLYDLFFRYIDLPFMDLVAFARVSDVHKLFAFAILHRRYRDCTIRCDEIIRGRQITYFEMYMIVKTFGARIRVENLPFDCELFLEELRLDAVKNGEIQNLNLPPRLCSENRGVESTRSLEKKWEFLTVVRSHQSQLSFTKALRRRFYWNRLIQEQIHRKRTPFHHMC